MADTTPRQCKAIARSGSQCKRIAILGGYVCVMHGGATPLARNAARARLMAMVEPAFAVLLEVMAESADEEVRLKAAIAVLDRTGHGPKSTIIVDDRRAELRELSNSQLLARAEALANQMRLLAGQDMMQPIIDVIDDDNIQKMLAAGGKRVGSGSSEGATKEQQPATQDEPPKEDSPSAPHHIDSRLDIPFGNDTPM